MRNKVVVLALIAVLVLALPVTALATAPTAVQNGLEVVAQGLNNPRGLAFGPEGALYVAEAGAGGEGPCAIGGEGSEVCYGPSGAVTRIDFKKGTQERVVTGLPSTAEGGNFASGPSDITFKGRNAFVIVGFGGNPENRGDFGEAGKGFGQLVRFTASGKWFNAVDVSAFEVSHNPDEGAVDSNPYGLMTVNGKLVITAPGGNDLLMVTPKGKISTLAVFPDRLVDAPPFLGLPPGTKIPMQAVPTAVTMGPDGAFYVAQLTGFPFPFGGANVWRVVPGQEPEIFADGFTNIIDLAFDKDGSLYVLEMFHNGLLAADPGDPSTLAGALIKVDSNGTRTTLASEGLAAPGGFAFGKDGAIYITNFAPFAGLGQVVKLVVED